MSGTPNDSSVPRPPRNRLNDRERTSLPNFRKVRFSRPSANSEAPLQARLVVVGLAVLIGTAIGFVLLSGQGNQASLQQVDPVSSIDDGGAAVAVLEAFCATRSIEERLELVRHPELTRPRMAWYYSREDHYDGEIEIGRAQSGAYEASLDLVWLTYRFEGGTWRTANFEKTADGLLLDWESLVAFEQIPLSELLWQSEGGQSEVYRVTLSLDDYYNFSFQPDRFTAFHLQDAKRRTSCWGYVVNDSECAKELERLFSRHGRNDINFMLRLTSHVPSAHERQPQLVIDEVVSDSWFHPSM